ncbi:MAG: hypothetical protein ACOYYS_07985 [Chloroflexota bacterium]
MPATPADITARGVLWQASRCRPAGRFWLTIPGVAHYLVEGGERIVVDVAGADRAAAQRFVGTAPLAALFYQRGMLALHAAAFLPDENRQAAVLLAGNSGAGKSTLLAALAQRGAVPLSDDLSPLALDQRGRVVVYRNPGFVRLWPDASRQLGIDGEVIDAGMFSPSFEHYPLAAIYWLSVHGYKDVEIRSVQGKQRFDAVGRLTYNTHIADALLERSAYFQLAAAITQQVPIVRVRRPLGRWCLDALIRAVSSPQQPEA